jgi:hypothetical protein
MAEGYGNVPGAAGSYFTWNRGFNLPTNTSSVWWVVHFKVNTAVGQTLPICGWNAAYGSLLITSANKPQMYVRTTTSASIGNVPSPNPIPNFANGQWMWLWAALSIPDAQVRYHYCLGYHLPSWYFLGNAFGTFPGGPLIATGTDVVTIGSRGTTPYVPITWDYFAEYINGSIVADINLMGRDTLPAGVSALGSSTFTPQVVKNIPPAVKDLYIGTERTWPLRVGAPLTPDGIVDIYQGGTKVWPGTGVAKWNVSQYDDGTVWGS